MFQLFLIQIFFGGGEKGVDRIDHRVINLISKGIFLLSQNMNPHQTLDIFFKVCLL